MPNVPIDLRDSHGTVAGYTFTSRRLWIPISLATKGRGRFWAEGLLDTGAPLSVIPFEVHTNENLDWQRVSDPNQSHQASWMDVPCDIGRVRVWLPDTNRHPHGPFFMVAKFPRAVPKALQAAPQAPILLGLDLFAAIQGSFRFQCQQAPAGVLIIP